MYLIKTIYMIMSQNQKADICLDIATVLFITYN